MDTLTGRRFLCDTGAQVSVLPVSPVDRQLGKVGPKLEAANRSKICTFGKRTVPLCLNGCRFTWEFVLADVDRPLLGADFLCTNGLLVDVRNRQLVDAKDFNSLPCTRSSFPTTTLSSALTSTCEFACLLAEFPDLVKPTFSTAAAKHGVVHHISMSGPPVHARSRRLNSAKLAAAKGEFANMEKLGIVRRSNSPWASPLHMVPKSYGGCRPCGDYCRLNDATIPDRYPVPHVQDFSARLAGKTVFSKVDLIRGYHQVPVNAEDIPKTAVITPFGLFEFLWIKKCHSDFPKDAEGAVPLPSKVATISEFPGPRTTRALQEFLGMVNFYNRFIPHAAALMRPLYGALRGKTGNAQVDWGEEMTAAFDSAKRALAEATMLSYPVPYAHR
ncbi:hypothetical protein AAFF_G00416040 [Aldrovandia affinis]|uniref:Reverse transcriptase domain-containing protein n=1 Tax=Aldrovandia affinis TaxID=143900 RepID=A0AAD7R3L0_9TELE|nr:hypothetical protein AAFF_G00416040 [Aldrovandia affinis]